MGCIAFKLDSNSMIKNKLLQQVYNLVYAVVLNNVNHDRFTIGVIIIEGEEVHWVSELEYKTLVKYVVSKKHVHEN